MAKKGNLLFQKRWARIGVGVLAPVLVLGLGYGFFRWKYPLEHENLKNRFEMWQAGVGELELGASGTPGTKIHAYERNLCQSAPCQCVALIHGMGDYSLSWRRLLVAPEKVWNSKPYRLVAIDLPGIGKSSAPLTPDGYRVRKQADAITAALKTMSDRCPRWLVVGNSLGGWIATWLALDHQEIVDRLLLLSPAGVQKSEDMDGPVAKLFKEPTIEGLKEFQARAYFKARPLPDQAWQAALKRMKSSPMTGLTHIQKPEDYLDGALSSVRKQTMILWGRADRIIPLEKGKIFKELIPGSVFQEIAECGHMPQKECPQVVIQAIQQLSEMGMM